ncbi:MAG: hypothetical protein J6S04_01910 [Clostridia bacterium]|nr:hypothetical protein [Clostridia bacterium]
MEIYNFYQAIKSSMALTNDVRMIIISSAISLVMWVGLFILQGFGIYAMATKQGVKNRALAFIPLVNILYIGKLAGECYFFGQRMKRAGMYAMIAQILAAVVSILTVSAEQYLWFTQGAPQMQTEYGYYWTGLTGFASHVSKFFDISVYVLSIFQLFAEIFFVVVMMGLCKKYAPKNFMLLSMVVLFIPIARFIIIFALRKRQPIDYEAYMRARHEAFMRRQQQYYNNQNPYGNPYGNPYANPYARPNTPYDQAQADDKGEAKPDEPFEEFASSDNGGSSDGAFDETNGSNDLFS